MSKPDFIAQDIWDTADNIVAMLNDMPTRETQIALVAGALTAERKKGEALRERQADQLRDLTDCLADMTQHYVELAASGDCGIWDADEEMEVQAARKMIAAIRTPSPPKPSNENFRDVPVVGEIR